ncbi:Enoyl-[acyl-carrier-protein] reductase [FMN] [Candidatus Paraburkholderia kirkii]|nr:Enoyl-[acyl-carrier-protein] reductase [FMN] [Candidatus Paraburkholderia kirkii]
MSIEDAKTKLEICFKHSIEVIACALGTPKWVVDACHERGVKTISIVGRTSHAASAIRAGTDVVVVQGTEGGGPYRRRRSHQAAPGSAGIFDGAGGGGRRDRQRRADRGRDDARRTGRVGRYAFHRQRGIERGAELQAIDRRGGERQHDPFAALRWLLRPSTAESVHGSLGRSRERTPAVSDPAHRHRAVAFRGRRCGPQGPSSAAGGSRLGHDPRRFPPAAVVLQRLVDETIATLRQSRGRIDIDA